MAGRLMHRNSRPFYSDRYTPYRYAGGGMMMPNMYLNGGLSFEQFSNYQPGQAGLMPFQMNQPQGMMPQQTQQGFNPSTVGAIGGIAGLAGGAVGGEGGSALSGAATGAATGAMLGPIGAVAGGLIGGASGLFGARKQKDAQEKARKQALKVANYNNAAAYRQGQMSTQQQGFAMGGNMAGAKIGPLNNPFMGYAYGGHMGKYNLGMQNVMPMKMGQNLSGHMQAGGMMNGPEGRIPGQPFESVTTPTYSPVTARTVFLEGQRAGSIPDTTKFRDFSRDPSPYLQNLGDSYRYDPSVKSGTVSGFQKRFEDVQTGVTGKPIQAIGRKATLDLEPLRQKAFGGLMNQPVMRMDKKSLGMYGNPIMAHGGMIKGPGAMLFDYNPMYDMGYGGKMKYKGGGKMYAGGGKLPQNVMQDPDVTYFATGGTHQQNPLGGIPIGNKGSVEEGEVRFGDFIFSNRF